MKHTPKIVVLDGYTLNPGDLTWDELKLLGECKIYDRTSPHEVLSRAAETEIILTNKTVLTGEIIEALPEMKYIGVLATGYNVVDIDTADRRHIPVTNVPEYGTRSVAQMVFALLLELTQHVAHHMQTVRSGRWTMNPDFCYWDTPLIELNGLTMGIVGYGKIGQEVARIARAFGMKVLIHDIQSELPDETEITVTDLDTLFRESDIVSLHCPLTPESREIVNARRLDLMKKTAFLINTARGMLVNEYDLAESLNSGNIAGACLDVLSVEPPDNNNTLLMAKNCFITPHISWATRAARKRLMDTAVNNIRTFLRGEPENVVNFM